MPEAKLKRLADDTLVCFHCEKPVMTDKGFLPCGCVKAAWKGLDVEKATNTAPIKAKGPGQKDAIVAGERFFKSFPNIRGLYLYGPPGTGKTYIAQRLFNAIVQKRNVTGANWFVPDLINQCRSEATNKKGDDFQQSYYEDAGNVKILLLDDLGAERATEFASDILNGIILRRERSELPIIITSNATPENLHEYVSERVASRIFGMCQAVKVFGEDLRSPE